MEGHAHVSRTELRRLLRLGGYPAEVIEEMWNDPAYKSLRVSLRPSSAAHACDRFRRDSAARTVGPADHISGVSPAAIPRRPSPACRRNARIAGPRRLLRRRERKPRPRSIPCALRTSTRCPVSTATRSARGSLGHLWYGDSATRASSSVHLVAEAVARSRREGVAAGASLAVLAPPCRRCATMCTCL
jgi:hypothetical protein